MSEQKAEYVTDAVEMLGTGYEVHAPHTVLTANDDHHLVQTEEGAWIKLSTTFRKVMPLLKGANLAVFIAICLGINDKGETYPALETLARWAGYSRRATQEAVTQLEKMGFLTIIKGVKKSNLYHIEAFAAFGEHNSPIGAEFAPVQSLAVGGAKSDMKKPQNMSRIAPELESLTRTNNKTEDISEEQKNFEKCAFQVFGNNLTNWHRLQNYLKNARYFREDGKFRISGIGMPAAMCQDLYARSFSNALAGVYNHPTEVVFEE